ncbi:DUF6896 domain-containing protein [Saccharothrix sp. NRRL B-16314]|uniref:DUF6896 domain-containing protein n=1 Tax=Saccharothrix sp. NRRL B-16314 TaxID=1463825 RepID=UPI0012DE673D|nr:hypothetical protein [Saccharothrix sp. NRRL B-16314]
MAPSQPGRQVQADGLPAADAVRRLVTRGRHATFPLAVSSRAELSAAAETLRTALASDDLHVIASPGAGSARTPSLTVLRLVDRAEIHRLHDRLQALVAEFRELAHRLAAPFQLHVEPACVRGDPYPDELDVDGEAWSLYVHGEHCLFTSADSGTEIEVHTDCPDLIDPWFLLRYAESADRYPDIRAACVEGFHDISRMLTVAAIPLAPNPTARPDACPDEDAPAGGNPGATGSAGDLTS